MKLIVPQAIARRLENDVRSAGRQEIGGVLVGEHIGDETFQIADYSVQRSGGSVSHFVRDPAQHVAFIESFFEKTGRDYQRYNYIGEWHSHPSFRPTPSGPDMTTMQELVRDPEAGVNFLLLLIARARGGKLELSATAFRANTVPIPIPLSSDVPPNRATRLLDNVIAKLRSLVSSSAS